MLFGYQLTIFATVRNLYLFLSRHCIGILTISHSQVIVNNFPNLRTIKFTIFHFAMDSNRNPDPSSYVCLTLLCEDFVDLLVLQINTLKGLNHLQTIIMRTPPPIASYWPPQQPTDRVKEYWIESAKRILIHIQLRDNLEKTVVMLDNDGNERRIVVKPESSLDSGFEEGSFA